MIRYAEIADSDKIAHIYNYYTLNTVITFEVKTLTADDIVQRIEKVNTSGFPWLVAEDNNEVIGYAYATKKLE